MKTRFRKSAICTAIAMAYGLAVPAGAQTAAPGQAAPAPASAPADAVDAEEVIVTARRVEERAQDVPISMSIFNQKQLDDRNVVSGGDLATYTPGLQANTEFGSDNTSFSIRGFVQQIATAPSVAVYFADVVAPRGGSAGVNTGDGGGPGLFFDLQNVQVLKGPQGTLFGRNTDGGAILLVPQRPTSELGGYLEAGFGDFDMWRVQGVLNVPVADNFRMRFGVDHESRRGYIHNYSGIGPENFNDIDYVAARGSAVWNITPNLENYTIVTFTNSDHNGSAQHVFACNPASGFGPSATAACEANMAQQGTGFWSTMNDVPNAHVSTEQAQLINTTTWSVNDNLTFKNIASLAKLTAFENNDLFGTAWNPAFFPPQYFGVTQSGDAPLVTSGVLTAPGHHLADMSTTTEELRLQGTQFGDRLTWQGGLYGEINEPIQPQGVASQTLISCQDPASLECGSSPFGSVNYQVGRLRYHDLGIYEQATFSLTEKLKLTEGLRYTMDQAQAHYTEGEYTFPMPNTTPYNPNNPTTPNGAGATSPVFSCTANPGVPVATLSACPFSQIEKSQAPTWTVGLDYNFTRDFMTYGKYSRGYRQGGINPTAPVSVQTWGPEKVDTFELGEKTSFDSFVRGTFNADVYYNNFRNQQLDEGFFCAPNSGCTIAPSTSIVNAGRSRIWGLEVESVLSPYKGFTINTSYSYINSKLKTFAAPAFPPNTGLVPTPTALVGGQLQLVPMNKVSTTATYVLPLAPQLGRIAASLGYTVTSGQTVSTPSTTPYYKMLGNGITNLNLDWTAIKGSRFDAGLFVTNLFDQRYAVYVPGLYDGLGYESEIPGEPRMFGGRVRMSFGG